jgi:hypothetical protein
LKTGDLIISVFLLAVFGWALAQSTDWPWEARALPALASGLGILLVAILIVPRIKELRRLDFRDVLPRTDMLALAAFMASVASVILLGVFWGGLLLVLTYTYLALGRDLPKAVMASLPVLLLPLLERALQVQLFQGLFRLSPPY